MWSLLSRWGGELGLSVGSLQLIQTSFHVLIWKMSLHLSLCSEIRASFHSGHPGIHSAWGSKLRVPLTFVLLREGSSWGACGKLAYHFSGRQESFSSWDDMGCTELSSSGYTEIDEIDEIERGISINHWSFLKGVQPLVFMMWIVGCLRVQCCRN